MAVSRPLQLVDSRGNPLKRELDRGSRRDISARYDAAQTSSENYRHWAEADHLSAKSANSQGVRFRLRTRSRYEVANNSYANGIVQTLANDLIGAGPRIQIMTPDPNINRTLEGMFCDWCDEVGLAEKLRTMRQSRAIDGEAFAFFETNENLSPVTLDVRLYEADQISTPYPYPLDPRAVDGIKFDEHMNPREYHRLKMHPGDDLGFAFGFEFDTIRAEQVIHWFRPDRPQQYRGVPDLTPALPLFAQLRRYTLAVLAAAETAAEFAAMLESELSADAESDDSEPFDHIPIEMRMLTTLPAGMKLAQLKAEQPVTTYADFKREILKEISRCLNMPFNIAAGDSSGYNYSSGRLDHQTYYRSLKVDRSRLEHVALDRIFAAWIAELETVPSAVPGGLPRGQKWPHRWLWQGMEHVDPEKEANAQETRLRNYMTTFSDECQAQGIDPESRAQTIANDVAMFERLGIPSPYAQPKPATPSPQGGNADGEPQNDQGSGQNGYAHSGFVRRNGHS